MSEQGRNGLGQDEHAPVGTGYPKAQLPIGVMLWGLVSEEVEEGLKQGVPRLHPQDWRSGDRLWVLPKAGKRRIVVIAPFGGAEAMVQDFKTNVFPDRPVSFVKLGAKGKEVGVL